MKLTFQLTNKDFEDSLMILVNGETRELTEEKNKATFEVEEKLLDTERIVVNVDLALSKRCGALNASLLAFASQL